MWAWISTRPCRHHHDAVGEIDRLLDAVGDEHDRIAVGLPNAQQFFLHQASRLRVERAEGLVGEQNIGVVGQSAGDRDALFHTT